MKRRMTNDAPRGLEVAAHSIRNTGFDLDQMQREQISQQSLRHKFDIIHTIDPGDGSVGAMNGGVFVVRMKGQKGQVYIEKRFKPKDVDFAQREIQMLRNVRHSSLTMYTAAFVTPDLRDASLYIEFCDRGSLENMMEEFVKRSKSSHKPHVPEAFVWHAFIGLCDGLAYLQTGESYYLEPNAKPKPGWIPILHRDIKPDNILLKSRHTLGSTKYFYCVLSDFGLACEDRDDSDPLVDRWQKSRLKLGTRAYGAPELLYEKFPAPDPYRPNLKDTTASHYPYPYRHSRYSDLWALGACMFNLCTTSRSRDTMNHLDLDSKPHGLSTRQYMDGTGCRVRDLRIPDRYSSQLRSAVRMATEWKVRDRPSPVSMIRAIEKLIAKSKFGKHGSHEPLQKWATKSRKYS